MKCEGLQPNKNALRWIFLVHLVGWFTVPRGLLVMTCQHRFPACTFVTSSLHRIKRSLIFGLSLHIFSPNPMLLCWYNLLVMRFPQVVVPQKQARKDFAHEDHLFGYCLQIAFFFPEFSFVPIPILQLSVVLNSLARMVFGLLTGSVARFLRRTPGRPPFHPLSTLDRSLNSSDGPIRFPQHLFSVHDHGRIPSDHYPYVSLTVRPVGDPVDSDPGAKLP